MHHSSPSEDLLLVTAKTIKGKPLFVKPSLAREVIRCLYRVQCFNPFSLYAFVVMPNHCHLLVGGKEYAMIVRTINKWKAAVNHEIGTDVWQSQFDLQIVTPSRRVVERIHTNPLRLGITATIDEYPWSSASGRWPIEPLPQQEEAPLLAYAKKFGHVTASVR